MATYAKKEENSPLDILTELAVEGTSSLVEAQRALLNLAQQENDIILSGVKQQVGAFAPAVAVTGLVQRSVETLIGLQQELLTTTSKQTLHWLESEKAGKGDRAARLADFAREGVESFTRAQKKFLDVLTHEAAKAASGKFEHEDQTAKKKEVALLAREAANAFIEAQKRLLDVMGQQMNVNLDATTKTLGLVSPARLVPIAKSTGEDVKDFVEQQKSFIGSLITRPKKVPVRAKARRKTARAKAVTV